MACLGLVTFLPLPPERSLPCFMACISRSTSLPAPGEYLRPEPAFFAEDFFEADFAELRTLDFFALEVLRATPDDFFAEDLRDDVPLRALAFFALVFFALDFFDGDLLADEDFLVEEDFFALLDFFFVAFLVAMRNYPPFELRWSRDSRQLSLRQATLLHNHGHSKKERAGCVRRARGFQCSMG